jgi:hypothetical protein
LLTAVMPQAALVSIRTRIGVLVLVRIPGHVVRRLALGRIWSATLRMRRFIAVKAINRGNIAERLQPGELTVTLRRGRRVIAIARGLARDLLPHTAGVVVVPLPKRIRGRVVAIAHVAAAPGARAAPATPPRRAISRAAAFRV